MRRMNLSNAPRVYTTAEAARILQIQESSIREAIRRGDLVGARIGWIYRIREEDLFEFFERRLVHGRRPPRAEGVP